MTLSKLAQIERARLVVTRDGGVRALVLPPDATWNPFERDGSPWVERLAGNRWIIAISQQHLYDLLLDQTKRDLKGEPVNDTERVLVKRLCTEGERNQALHLATMAIAGGKA